MKFMQDLAIKNGAWHTKQCKDDGSIVRTATGKMANDQAGLCIEFRL
jgi:hypothetical protein